MVIVVRNVVYECLKNLAQDLNIEEFLNPSDEMKIYTGFGGKLDSLGMVNLVAELEDILSSMLDKEVILADDKMMSSRNSPLKDVKSLIEYVDKKIKEL